MAGVIPRFTTGPVTYNVVETVRGGQIVEARAGSKVGVAGAGSTKVLGVATKDATPPASQQSVDAFGRQVTNLTEITEFVAVGHAAEYPVTYAAAAAFGDPLVAAANGQVAPAGAAPDARTIIGRCTEPAGVALGAVGLARIF